MAGRYVVLEFDDRDAANAFVKMEKIHEQLDFTPVAMYLKPRRYCECPDKPRQNLNNWRKHPKYGISVCVRCGLPSWFYNQGILKRLQWAFGYSILEDQ